MLELFALPRSKPAEDDTNPPCVKLVWATVGEWLLRSNIVLAVVAAVKPDFNWLWPPPLPTKFPIIVQEYAVGPPLALVDDVVLKEPENAVTGAFQ